MSEDEIRKEFEAWIGQDCSAWYLCWKDENIPGEYHYASTQQAWQAYRAGRNAALEAAAKVCEDNIVVIALKGGAKGLMPRNIDDGSSGDGDVYGQAIRALKEQSNG